MNLATRNFTRWFVPTASLALVGSMTFAIGTPDDGNKNSMPNGSHGKRVHFKHDDEIDTYLTSIRSFMLEPPRDGRFGASRIPMLHGKTHDKIPGYESVKAVASNEYIFQSFVVGHMPEERLRIYEQAVKKGQIKPEDIQHYRVTMVHFVLSEAARQQPTSGMQSSSLAVAHKIRDVAETCFKNGYDDFSDSFDAGPMKSWISAKAVRATDKSCYSCHTNVKEGEPIGYVMAILLKKSP